MNQQGDPLLSMVLNLAQFHREHEKFYSESPLHDAITLQRSSRALKALAERWSSAQPEDAPSPSPFAGAPDLNDERAVEQLGILFMESGGEPAELKRLKSDLGSLAESYRGTGEWLAAAMEAAWGVAEALLPYEDLADLLAERHHIIANDWQSASMAMLIANHIDRALKIIEHLDLSLESLRADLAGSRVAPRYLFSASEMLDRAADLASESAVLTHENERRWRVFHDRVEELARG